MDFPIIVRHSSGISYPVGGWNWDSPARPHYNLWVSFKGEGLLSVNGQVHRVSPGFALLLHPEDAILGRKSAEVAFCNIALHFNLRHPTTRGDPLRRFRFQPTQLRNLSVIFEMTRYLVRLIEAEGTRCPSDCDALGSEILKIFIRDWELGPEDPVDAKIRKQSDVIRSYPEREWSLSLMAEGAGLSVSQFTRRFSALFRTSPNAFLIRARINKAKELLNETTLSISEVSDRLGYSDVSFFSRQFRVQVGVSPKVFRQVRMQNNPPIFTPFPSPESQSESFGELARISHRFSSRRAEDPGSKRARCR